MKLTNYEIALRLSKGENIELAVIRDKKGVILHLKGIVANCINEVKRLEKELK